ncbi:Ligand-gated ion channel, partial [Ancylostoma ceylanicum]
SRYGRRTNNRNSKATRSGRLHGSISPVGNIDVDATAKSKDFFYADELSMAAIGKFLSAIWWMFTLVLFAQYTANFAAVLTVDRKNMPFNSFEELGNQSDYKFGAILGGSTMQFFKYSRIETFRRLWEAMLNQTPTAFVEKNEDGVLRALQEKYVFLMESATLDYQVTQNCNLTRVGNVVLGSNGYRSKWREKLTRQILDLNEKGIIMMLKETWWKKRQQ